MQMTSLILNAVEVLDQLLSTTPSVRLEDVIAQLTSLQNLSIDAGNFLVKPWTFNHLTGLTRLRLQGLKLGSNEHPLNVPSTLSRLAELDLSANFFKSMPDWVSQLTQLTHLDMSHQIVTPPPPAAADEEFNHHDHEYFSTFPEPPTGLQVDDSLLEVVRALPHMRIMCLQQGWDEPGRAPGLCAESIDWISAAAEASGIQITF